MRRNVTDAMQVMHRGQLEQCSPSILMARHLVELQIVFCETSGHTCSIWSLLPCSSCTKASRALRCCPACEQASNAQPGLCL